MKKRIVSLLLSAVMLVGILPFGAITAFAESKTSIPYLNEEGTLEYVVDPLSVSADVTELTAGIYLVDSDLTIDHRIYAAGDVTLILADGILLSVNGGIGLAGDNTVPHTLTITAQSFGANAGRLTVSGGDDNHAGIGADEFREYPQFAIVINGGNLSARGGWGSAGIGAGWGHESPIGLGEKSICGDITVNGGTVIANGGFEGSGIGTGNKYGGQSACGTITINGGNVTANGGSESAGIGCGYEASCGDIVINGGNVAATGGESSTGIGCANCSAYHSDCGNILINGGRIKATGDDSANDIGASVNHSRCISVSYAEDVLHETENGSTWVNLAGISGTPATCSTSGYREAYVTLPENLYYSAFPFTEADLIGEEADFAIWHETESKGFIPPLGHEWEDQYYYNDGHKCLRGGCGLTEAHADGNGDLLCDACGRKICPHTNTTAKYEWEDGPLCTATLVCDDCGAALCGETLNWMNLTPHIVYAADCRSDSYVYYVAKFDSDLFETQQSEKYGLEPGPHQYNENYVCIYHGTEQPLADAKKSTKSMINAATGDDPTPMVDALAVAARAAINDAADLTELRGIRDEWLAAIEALTVPSHTHAFSSEWSCNELTHWREATCAHDVVSEFGAHTFDGGDRNGNVTVYTCTECGYQKIVYDQVGDEESELIGGVRFTGVSLTLDSDIYMNFYMELTEDAAENGTMRFLIGNRKVENVKVQHNSNGYYFTCALTVLELATDVTAEFTYYKTYTEQYSVADYIETILTGDYSSDLKTLANKIANYGHYAQLYLADIHKKVVIGEGGYAPMAKSGEAYDIDVPSAVSALTDTFVTPEATANFALYGRTVYFDSATALNYYVIGKTGEPLTSDAVTCKDKNGKTRAFEVQLYKDNLYIVSVMDISATELADAFTVTVGDLVLESSVLDYCGAVVLANGDETDASDRCAVNAMAAIYEYYQAACAYAASIK